VISAGRRRRFPRELPCLACDRLRLSSGPADRLCPGCRATAARLDSGPALRVLR